MTVAARMLFAAAVLFVPKLCHGQSPQTQSSAPATQLSTAASRPASRPAAGAESAPPPQFDDAIPADQWGDDRQPIVYQMLVAAAIVVVLGVLTYVVIKKFVPGLRRPPEGGISIIASTYLGPKKTAHVLRVGSRKILVACWRDGVAPLGDVTDAFQAEATEQAASFRQVARNVGAENPKDADDESDNTKQSPEN